ncbi:DNA-directed RNA polymerase subunit N, putative [Entamoeba histolytica HM-1:IMSS-B]|uniref:DNA-directed RNA polymerases I, II, and III subunit RPABC5 n=7 Tax=Entamoeba TaxID=5758 RepID=C4M5M4_ENTH1|nr:DNA-directed RNA polymerase subunit N, putative [Entamoeba nuttalli P19]XP_654226.1 DNA-directed RNA polymerase subunit N, putative [Entamoeba histolytica HM-1:IMSS]EMD42572.1 DNA-directed RNA polymerase subunit N, putative [Entamoeba histolytica KU27]EMH74802.1 DNA-directed RNA polymerase subunit N, putative [Entamoeba histolytica HM-1:IMSS-B]EMS16822.1 DNA-directed RNA polymerase subunit N, putative [Entamoeba histolytica HM-3:IMSS]ENY63554.1 DNA-directed RNA polymerase subunit N, putativ|eukprot:XP_008859996.1 DNA-directed RNA polymerase subunit N, putative [Entamoeba nuttalli P19]
MIIPVRCFTCGKVIGNKWEKFLELATGGKVPMDQVFSELGIERYCCKRMLVSHVNLIGFLSMYDLPSESLKKA